MNINVPRQLLSTRLPLMSPIMFTPTRMTGMTIATPKARNRCRTKVM